MPQQGDCRGFTWGICGNGSFNCQTQEQLVDEWLLIAVWDKPTFLSIWMMLPLFWWKQPSMYSLLLQPCWLLNLCISTGHVFTSLYVAHTLSTIHSSRQTFCFHYKNVKRLKHMTYLAIICGKKNGLCISRFHRAPSASMAFCAWQTQQLRRGNWPAKHGTTSSNMEISCNLIHYHKR